FDLIFLDADKANLPDYFTWSVRLSRPGTLIVIDNVIREGEVVDAKSPDAAVQGVRRMNERIAAEPRVAATTLQTVGAKGYAGLGVGARRARSRRVRIVSVDGRAGAQRARERSRGGDGGSTDGARRRVPPAAGPAARASRGCGRCASWPWARGS